MAKSVASRNRTSRTKGRQGEFAVREMIARFYRLHPDTVLLRSKSANGCDVIVANSDLKLFPFSVEVKNRKSIPYFEVVRQMKANTETDTFPLSIILNEKEGHTSIIPVEVLLPMIKLLNEFVPNWRDKVFLYNEIFNKCVPKIKDARSIFQVS